MSVTDGATASDGEVTKLVGSGFSRVWLQWLGSGVYPTWNSRVWLDQLVMSGTHSNTSHGSISNHQAVIQTWSFNLSGITFYILISSIAIKSR